MGTASIEMDVDVQLGCICLTGSGKTLLAAGTDLGRPGTVRAYAYPLTGHFVEYQVHSGPGKCALMLWMVVLVVLLHYLLCR